MAEIPKILLFEKEIEIQRTFERILSSADYVFQRSGTRQELIEAAASEDFDILFLDLSQSPSDDILLVEEISKLTPESLLILVAHFPLSAMTIKRLQPIVFDYLAKPIVPEALFKTFFNALYFQKYQKIQVQTAAALSRSEERCCTLIENIEEGYCETDLEGRITFTNESMDRIIGLHEEQIIGAKSKDILIRQDAYKIDRLFHQIYSQKRKRRFKENLTKKNGQELFIEAFIELVYDNNQHPIGFKGVVRDITAQEIAEKQKIQLECQLHQAQKMEAIGTLAGGIAHDFNNILSAIIGYTELSLQDAPVNTLLYSNLSRILNAGERARDLVRQILTFSRETDREFEPILIQPIVKEAMKLLRASLPATITVQTRIESDATVLADPTQIHQIMINLCTNASHAMQESGGTLSVSLTNTDLNADFCKAYPDLKPGVYMKIQVSDTGTGIPPQLMKRIFEPFFTTKERGKGTGMGLAVVHGIVKSHHGVVIVTSEPGKGSAFDIYIPVVSIQSPPMLKSVIGPLPMGSERILFVDDETVQKDLAKQMLERLGYRVTTRNSSREALTLFSSNPDQFDLVITDMTMPSMTGDVLAREIMHLRPDIPIIICTGYSEKLNEEKALSMGAKGFMMKPLVMKEIAALIRNILSPL